MFLNVTSEVMDVTLASKRNDSLDKNLRLECDFRTADNYSFLINKNTVNVK